MAYVGGMRSGAVAVPSSHIQPIPGYGSPQFGSACVSDLPPQAVVNPMALGISVPVAEKVSGPGELTPEQAKMALLSECNMHCCWGKSVAENMSVIGIKACSELLVKVETHIETRNSFLVHHPYRGEMYTQVGTGRAPQPWEIPQPAVPFFNSSLVLMEIPFTSYVQMCYHCGGRGYHMHRVDDREERRTCSSCQGHCKIRFFMELEIVHQTLINEKVIGEMANEVPAEVLDGAGGNTLLNFSSLGVPPINQGWEPAVCETSLILLQSANGQVISKKSWQHQQRITVTAENVFRVSSNSKPDNSGKPFNFYVVGDIKRVYAPEYPAQCCCGLCTIC